MGMRYVVVYWVGIDTYMNDELRCVFYTNWRFVIALGSEDPEG